MRNVLHELFDGKLSRDQMEYEKGKAYSRAYDAAVVAEEELLETLCADERFAARWRDFRSLSRIERAEQPDERDGWRRIRAKKSSSTDTLS